MKSSSFPSLPHLLAALLLTAGASQATLAADADPLGRVEVQGQPSAPLGRTDVRATCPGVDEHLQGKLSRSWYLEQKPGVVRVDFEIDGREISEVRASGGPRYYYQQAIRQAVHGLRCDNQQAGEQRFTMLISFAAEGEVQNPQQAIALLQP